MTKQEIGDDCVWDHCSSIATCPCCRKDIEIELLTAALQAILDVPAAWGDEAYEMEELAEAALKTYKEGDND